MNQPNNNNLIPNNMQNGYQDIKDLHLHMEQQIEQHVANHFANVPYRHRLITYWLELLADHISEENQNEQEEPHEDGN